MFGPLGVPEVLFILVLALLIFGPRRLPELGRTFGRAMGEFRRASNELKRSINSEIALEEESRERRPRPVAPAASPGPQAAGETGDREPAGPEPAESEPAGSEPAGPEPAQPTAAAATTPRRAAREAIEPE